MAVNSKKEDDIKNINGAFTPDFGFKSTESIAGHPNGASSSNINSGSSNIDSTAGNTSLNGTKSLAGKTSKTLEVASNIGSTGKISGAFIYIILNRLYYLIAIPAMIITYNVFKVLNEPDSNGKSILDKISDIITEALADIIEISYHCPALIGNIPKFLDCLGF